MAERRGSFEKEQFWRWVLEEQAASGRGVQKFCRQESLSAASLYYWRRRMHMRDLPDSKPDAQHALPEVAVLTLVPVHASSSP